MSAKPTLTPQEFSAKWASSRLKEHVGAQDHFIEVCRLIGHETSAEKDPEGEFFTFERTVSKVGG